MHIDYQELDEILSSTLDIHVEPLTDPPSGSTYWSYSRDYRVDGFFVCIICDRGDWFAFAYPEYPAGRNWLTLEWVVWLSMHGKAAANSYPTVWYYSPTHIANALREHHHGIDRVFRDMSIDELAKSHLRYYELLKEKNLKEFREKFPHLRESDSDLDLGQSDSDS